MAIKNEDLKKALQIIVTDTISGEVTTVVNVKDTQIGTTSDPRDLLVKGNVECEGASVGPTTFVPIVAGGRLTVSSSFPVLETSVTSSSQIFYVPYVSNQISLYDGTNWQLYNFSAPSLTLSGMVSGSNYDVFAYVQNDVVTLSSESWQSNTARQTSFFALQDGIPLLASNKAKRYIGSFRATSTSTTADSTSQRFVWNKYNQFDLEMSAVDTTNTWTYVSPSSAWRRVRTSSSTNFFEFICGDTTSIDVFAKLLGAPNSAGTAFIGTGVGINSTTVNAAPISGDNSINTVVSSLTSRLVTRLTASYYHVNWLETGESTITYTFYGDGGLTFLQTGMVGRIKG